MDDNVCKKGLHTLLYCLLLLLNNICDFISFIWLKINIKVVEMCSVKITYRTLMIPKATEDSCNFSTRVFFMPTRSKA